jgi:hypothetical protein
VVIIPLQQQDSLPAVAVAEGADAATGVAVVASEHTED